MFHDVKAPTPSKGKAKEESHWHCGWWEVYPLLEPRPVEWTCSSTLFTAHPTQPLLVARLFSSSKQFTISPPSPIASSPTSYEPPTIISVSPNDEWLFAYFPGRDGDGTGCLWKRGMQVDVWAIKEWWNFAGGAGVVTASWAGNNREWVVNSAGKPIRLPPCGPTTPVSSPTLLLVTQTQQLHVCYVRTYIPSLKIMICSLTQPGVTLENHPNPIYDIVGGSGGIKLCSNATIGMGYNESSILVAMRSHLLPSPIEKSPSFNPMDLSLPLGISQQTISSENNPSIDWRPWGEESIIELCEIQLSFDGVLMSLTSNPLPPIHHSDTHLSNLTFICTPPAHHLLSEQPRPFPIHRQKEKSRSDDNENGRFYLAASFLDFGDYTAAPQSKLVLHSISRNVSVPNAKKPTWISHHESSRSFSSGVLTFVSSSTGSSNLNAPCVYAGILDTSGTISQTRSKTKEVSVGYVTVLKLPDLQNHGEWENSLIMLSVDRVGKELPLYAAISPNITLLCTVTSSLSTIQTSIHALPKQRSKSTAMDIMTRYPLSASLASAIHSRRTVSDLTHNLSLPITSIDDVVETLYSTLSILEGDHNGLSIWAWDVLGVVVNVYRTRAHQTGQSTDRRNLTARSQTAHDMCSIIACNFAFEDCKEGESYALDAVWQLVALSGWVIDFLEKLMKECVLFSDVSGPSHQFSNDLSGSGPPSSATDPKTWSLDSPTLLHLIQPFALTNLHGVLGHVKRFRKQLGTLSATGETAQIAKDVLIDLVDCSGINLNVLESIFVEIMPDAKALGADDIRRSLALCHPTPAMDAPLRKVISKLTTSNVLDKPRLFLKVSDLADGTSRLILNDQPNKDKDKDVVSKGVLINRGSSFVCLGCGDRSEVGGIIAGHISLGWRAWEKMWTSRCICGGLWASGSI